MAEADLQDDPSAGRRHRGTGSDLRRRGSVRELSDRAHAVRAAEGIPAAHDALHRFLRRSAPDSVVPATAGHVRRGGNDLLRRLARCSVLIWWYPPAGATSA